MHHHLRPPPRGGYLRGSKAAQSSMIPSHMFTEHQRSETRARRTRCWQRGPPRRTCRLLESRKHESAKGALSAPAAPKTGCTYANRAWILGIWRRAQPFALSFRWFKIMAFRNSQAIILVAEHCRNFLYKKLSLVLYSVIILYHIYNSISVLLSLHILNNSLA